MKGRDVGVAVCILTDGRDYLRQAIPSLMANFPWMPSDHTLLINDSADSSHARILLADYPNIDRQLHHAHRRGLAGAVRSAWSSALDFDCEFVFHVEDDFLYNCEIPIGRMADMLDGDPTLAQVSLARQPVNPEEWIAGGFMQRSPDSYHQCDGYLSHNTVFSFNPCLVPRSVIELCLAEPRDGLERGFTDTLLSHGMHFGVYGAMDDAPRVNHIGASRSAGWQV
jgi:hypothetical protein